MKPVFDYWAFNTKLKTAWVVCYIMRFPEKPFEFLPQPHGRAFTSEREARDYLAWISVPNGYSIVKVDVMERDHDH